MVLPVVVNGSYSFIEAPPNVPGHRARLTCDNGYVPSGNEELTLVEGATPVDLVWNLPPGTCDPALQEKPDEPANGSVSSTDGPLFKLGSKAAFACDDDYHLTGAAESVLEMDGTQLRWNPVTSHCAPLLTDLPVSSSNRGRFRGVGNNGPYGPGAEAALHCDPGYDARGAKSVVVVEGNGLRWQPGSAECVPVACPDPPTIEHATYGGVDFTFPKPIQYICEAGYLLSGHEDGRFACGQDGKWTPDIPAGMSCAPVFCPALLPPLDGKVVYEDRTFTSQAFYSCDEGYKIGRGDARRECTADGTWSGDEVTCVPVVPCPISNDMKPLIGMITEFNVTLKCEDGRSELIPCENGQWGVEPPYCVPLPVSQPFSSVEGGGGDPIDLGTAVHSNKNRQTTLLSAHIAGNRQNRSAGAQSTTAAGTQTTTTTATTAATQSTTAVTKSTAAAAAAGKTVTPAVSKGSFSYVYWIIAIIITIITSVLVWIGTRFWLGNRARLGTVKM